VTIAGVWRLDSFESRDGRGVVSRPMGEHPSGLLIYTASGWMSVQVAHGARIRFTSEDPLLAPPDQQAHAFATAFIFYSGRYEVQGDHVRHFVETSVPPNWAGTVLERLFEIAGDRLMLRTPPTGLGGTMLSSELRWHRVG
jgi:lipocalin-like protein